MESHSPQQLIKLPTEAIDCVPTRLEQISLGFRPDADAEELVGTSDNLQWLSKIVADHGEEHGLKVVGPLRIRPACRSQGYWPFGRPHDAGFPDVSDNRNPFLCVGHDVLSSNNGIWLNDLSCREELFSHFVRRSSVILISRSDNHLRYGA